MMNKLTPRRWLPALAGLAIAACNGPVAPTASPALANTTPAMAGDTAQTAVPGGGASTFGIVFETYDARIENDSEFRAKLRMKTSGGETFVYRMPIGHLDCYFYSGDRSVAFVDGDEADLICSGGGEHDHARVKRKSATSVEVSFFQEAFAGPDTPPNKRAPYNEQTFSIAVPKGAKIHATFQKGAAPGSGAK